MYTILGATGNIGSVITRKLLDQGEKVRVVGRNAGRLQPFVQKGAEAFVADVKDAAALTKALTGVRAAFLMLPPNMTSPDYRAQVRDVLAISGEPQMLLQFGRANTALATPRRRQADFRTNANHI